MEAPMSEKRPLILITNDDGIEAKGVHELVKMIEDLGDIVVVAPDSPRSGQSSALSVGIPLRLTLVEHHGNISFYRTNGTPVDCVKLSINQLFDRRPDLLLSGINHGSNSGVSIVYSGTMGAALEGCIIGIPSIGFSLGSHDPNADFSHCREIVRESCRKVLENGLPRSVCLNINIPAIPHLKGIRVCRQAQGYWTEEYDHRIDPHGKDYYWLTGHFMNLEPENEETDEWALAHGYISIVPCTCDQTAYPEIPVIQELFATK
ncbi:5'/3'-nucleotidase SurE [Coprobacter sp.]